VAYGIGSLLQPVFTGGRLRAQVRLSEAEEKEMLWTYRKTVANAFREVSDALIAAKEQQNYREEQSKLVAAAEEATQLALLRYRAGSTSYLEFLVADSALYSARLNEVDAREREALLIGAAICRFRRRLASVKTSHYRIKSQNLIAESASLTKRARLAQMAITRRTFVLCGCSFGTHKRWRRSGL